MSVIPIPGDSMATPHLLALFTARPAPSRSPHGQRPGRRRGGDERILREATRPGESTSDTLRRALRLLDHERWLAQFRADAENLKDEDVNTEPEAW